jgi:hypothetical protein
VDILRTKGIYQSEGKILLNSLKTIQWKDISDSNFPKLPAGSTLELSITLDENIFLSGINGIVWATYDARQAEVIHNTLLVQNIQSEVIRIEAGEENIIAIRIFNTKDINAVTEFIWKGGSGLRLKPDWNYPEGESNKSFEIWLNGQ